MTTAFINTPEVQDLLNKLSGLDQDNGDVRMKAIIRRVVGDLFDTIEEFDISDDEFWTALNYVATGAQELGLWAAGLGVERFLDMRADRKDAEAGITGVTARTIEGPLYVAGAPESVGFARMDDGSEEDKAETMILHGQVCDVDGTPLAGAKVEIWHCNTLGNYSYFDQTQTDFNLRRTVVTDAEGNYAVRSILPVGYACPPNGSTEGILTQLGRHGHRPAHIHFFISKDGHRHLTTQINIDGDPYLYDDFAYATREELVPPLNHIEHSDLGTKYGVDGKFAEIEFNINLIASTSEDEEHASVRPRATLAA